MGTYCPSNYARGICVRAASRRRFAPPRPSGASRRLYYRTPGTVGVSSWGAGLVESGRTRRGRGGTRCPLPDPLSAGVCGCAAPHQLGSRLPRPASPCRGTWMASRGEALPRARVLAQPMAPLLEIPVARGTCFFFASSSSSFFVVPLVCHSHAPRSRRSATFHPIA